jgi:hypothetical protein
MPSKQQKAECKNPSGAYNDKHEAQTWIQSLATPTIMRNCITSVLKARGVLEVVAVLFLSSAACDERLAEHVLPTGPALLTQQLVFLLVVTAAVQADSHSPHTPDTPTPLVVCST